MLTKAELETRVARGVDYLDQHRPGWQDAIDLNRLCLASGCRCVLGQLGGSENSISWTRMLACDNDGYVGHWEAMRLLNSELHPADCGFVLEAEPRDVWRLLEDIWIEVIGRLQQAELVTPLLEKATEATETPLTVAK